MDLLSWFELNHNGLQGQTTAREDVRPIPRFKAVNFETNSAGPSSFMSDEAATA